jgi:hypothetical protein
MRSGKGRVMLNMNDLSTATQQYLSGEDGLVHELIGANDAVCGPANQALAY